MYGHCSSAFYRGDLIEGPVLSQTQNGKTIAKGKVRFIEKRGETYGYTDMPVEVYGNSVDLFSKMKPGWTIEFEGKFSRSKFVNAEGREYWSTCLSIWNVCYCGPSSVAHHIVQQQAQAQPQTGYGAPAPGGYQQPAQTTGYGAPQPGYHPPAAANPYQQPAQNTNAGGGYRGPAGYGAPQGQPPMGAQTQPSYQPAHPGAQVTQQSYGAPPPSGMAPSDIPF